MGISRASSTSEPSTAEKDVRKQEDAVVRTGADGRIDEEAQGETEIDGVFGAQGKGSGAVDYRRCVASHGRRRFRPSETMLTSELHPLRLAHFFHALAMLRTVSAGSRHRSS